MINDTLINLFYNIQSGCICNFLSGIAMLYFILSWLPYGDIKAYDPFVIIIAICMFIFVGILPTLSYNLIRFRMVKSGELNYGICRYTLSTVLPFIAPMLIYGIAYLNGFRL